MITSGAVTIDIFLPDVAENLVTDSQCAGEVWQGTVGGAQGRGGEDLVVCWGGECGGGQEKPRKINAVPLLSLGGTEFRRY